MAGGFLPWRNGRDFFISLVCLWEKRGEEERRGNITPGGNRTSQANTGCSISRLSDDQGDVSLCASAHSPLPVRPDLSGLCGEVALEENAMSAREITFCLLLRSQIRSTTKSSAHSVNYHYLTSIAAMDKVTICFSISINS